MDAAALLKAFAELAPAGVRVRYDVTDSNEPFVWLGSRMVATAQPELAWGGASWAQTAATRLSESPPSIPNSSAVKRLRALDALHFNERLLREGWVFVCGTSEIDGKQQSVCLPLISRPVRISSSLLGTYLFRAGDDELIPLVSDPAVAARLEGEIEFGGGAITQDDIDPRLLARLTRLQQWIKDVAGAANLEIGAVLTPATDPTALRSAAGLVVVVGSGLYLARDVSAPDLSATLLHWAGRRDLDGTAFAAMYADQPAEPGDAPVATVRSPMPLSERQMEAVQRARRERVTVLSGAPGSGKSHTVVAIALDAIERGECVLVAAQSNAAVDVLADLLDRQPGPTPVLFGDAERREVLASRLAMNGARVGRGRLEDRDRIVASALARVGALEAAVGRVLTVEARAEDWARYEPLLPGLAGDLPGLFDADQALDRLQQLALTARADTRGWWARRRTRKALRRLRGAARAPSASLEQLEIALAASTSRRAAAELAAHGGTTIGSAWQELFRADAELALALSARLSDRAAAAETAAASRRRAVVALAAALRAGRGRRRAALEQIDGSALVEALPLWVGTLRDINDLLPTTPQLFDLLLLDEASQIDQIRAAPALLRATRVVVAGDPHQLRHVSFLSDAAVTQALANHRVAQSGDRLDIRRMSAFDCACGTAPTTWLDEHFRSVPHLIAFSAARFYRTALKLMTRRPDTECVDAIDVVRVNGTANDRGVVLAEVEAALRLVAEFAEQGLGSIGVITPFRAQADALEDALISAFSVEDIERLGLRAGTVHSFQGGERDIVIASLALTDADTPNRRQFVNDPNLFNVMITRARTKIVVVTSLRESVNDLVSAYLEHAERPPPRMASAAPGSEWARALGTELERLGIEVRAGYEVGHWTVDLCVGSGSRAVAVLCSVHHDGARAHIERNRALSRAGWHIREAFASVTEGDAPRAAIAIAGELRAAQ